MEVSNIPSQMWIFSINIYHVPEINIFSNITFHLDGNISHPISAIKCIMQSFNNKEICKLLYLFSATYPLAGGQGEKPKARLPKRKMRGVATNVYVRKTSEKPKKK